MTIVLAIAQSSMRAFIAVIPHSFPVLPFKKPGHMYRLPYYDKRLAVSMKMSTQIKSRMELYH